MSFILDALKKSEAERHRQLTPGLIDPGYTAPRTGLPAWAVVLLLLLGINIIGVCVVLLRGGAPQRVATRTASRPAEPLTKAVAPRRAVVGQPNGSASPEAFSPMDNTPQYAPEIPVAEAPTAQPGAATAGESQTARAPKFGQPPATGASATEEEEPLPTIAETDFGGAGSPPELHLDVHVYASNPTERFVFINGRKYVEGSALQDDLRVERIRRDGVVLNYRGKRFLLPRR